MENKLKYNKNFDINEYELSMLKLFICQFNNNKYNKINSANDIIKYLNDKNIPDLDKDKLIKEINNFLTGIKNNDLYYINLDDYLIL